MGMRVKARLAKFMMLIFIMSAVYALLGIFSGIRTDQGSFAFLLALGFFSPIGIVVSYFFYSEWSKPENSAMK